MSVKAKPLAVPVDIYSQVGINKRLGAGDTHICISDQINTVLMNKLQAQPNLTDQEIQGFIVEVDDYFRKSMH